MHKILIQAPKIMRQMATDMIWIWYPSHTTCMFHILLEVGAERKVPKLGTSILKRLTSLQKQ